MTNTWYISEFYINDYLLKLFFTNLDLSALSTKTYAF